MAGRIITLSSGAVSVSNSVVKTLISVAAPANIAMLVHHLSVFAENSSGSTLDSTDRQVVVTLGRVTAASGTGTTGTTFPIWRSVDHAGGTVQMTFRYNFSGEPTYTTGETLSEFVGHPAGGVLRAESFGLGDELVIGSGEEVALKVVNTTGDTLNFRAELRVEE